MARKEEIVFELKSREEKQALDIFLESGQADFQTVLAATNSKLLQDTNVINNILSQTDETQILIGLLLNNSDRSKLYNTLDLDYLLKDIESTLSEAKQLLSEMQQPNVQTMFPTVQTSTVNKDEVDVENLVIDPETGLINVDEIVDLIPDDILSKKEEDADKEKNLVIEEENKKNDKGIIDAILGFFSGIFSVIGKKLWLGLASIGTFLKTKLVWLVKSIGRLIPWVLKKAGPVLLANYLTGDTWQTIKEGFNSSEELENTADRRADEAIDDIVKDIQNFNWGMTDWEAINTGKRLGINTLKYFTNFTIGKAASAYNAAKNFFTGEDESTQALDIKTTPISSEIVDVNRLRPITKKETDLGYTPRPSSNKANNISYINNQTQVNNYLDNFDYDDTSNIVYMGGI